MPSDTSPISIWARVTSDHTSDLSRPAVAKKIPGVVIFPENNVKFMYFLSNSRTEFSKFGTYCVRLCTNVEINNKV